jgi:hypothetical protein
MSETRAHLNGSRPAPMASTPPRNLTGIKRNGAGERSPRITASTWGMPLPDACGEYRRTNQAANAAAAAHAVRTKRKPPASRQ